MAAHNEAGDLLYERKLESFDLSVRTFNSLRYAGVHTIGQLVALKSTDIRKWPGTGSKTLCEIEILLGSVGLRLADSQARPKSDFPPVAQVDSVPPGQGQLQLTFLEEELYRFARAIFTERDANILIRRLGWDGQSPRTLETVGQEFEITRERVRQVEKRSLQRLRKHRFKSSIVAEAIDILINLVPDTVSALAAALQERGISRNEFSPESLQGAAEILGIKWPFEFFNVGENRMLSLAGEGARYRRAVSLVRKKTSDQGCMSILSLAFELQLAEGKIPGLRRVLDTSSKFEWLDESREWLYASDCKRNRLVNLCSKVLGVASHLHLSELRRAVSKSRRLAMCPPQRILSAFVLQCGLGHVEESIVFANSKSGMAPAVDSVEGLMLRVLSEQGPVMDGEVFAEACIAAGVNATTFYLYRVASPVICALGKNVYCKVGADVPPGTVESIVASRRTAARFSDHGWTPDGRLWWGAELTRQVITSGGIRLPAFVANFVQGEWQVMLPDESGYGSVTCREVFIWSFRKPFEVLGAEPTDIAAFEFDLKSRKVLVRLGGQSLFDAMQESDNATLVEGTEEA